MFNFKEKYKRLFIIGIILLFSNSAVFAHVKTCCQMGKTQENHSCCANKASFSYKQASKCECRIGIAGDLVSENKSDVIDDLLKHSVSFARNNSVINVPSENNDKSHDNELLFKSCSVPIFLKDCSFLI
ncbi:MAG: hypothetical protein PHX78_04960 [bacterium]|nr:hypothetical protein [bacterium]